jgi:hypothetical protein
MHLSKATKGKNNSLEDDLMVFGDWAKDEKISRSARRHCERYLVLKRKLKSGHLTDSLAKQYQSEQDEILVELAKEGIEWSLKDSWGFHKKHPGYRHPLPSPEFSRAELAHLFSLLEMMDNEPIRKKDQELLELGEKITVLYAKGMVPSSSVPDAAHFVPRKSVHHLLKIRNADPEALLETPDEEINNTAVLLYSVKL